MITNPTIYWQVGGEAGIRQTVYQMIQLVNRSFLHPYIRDRAATLVSHCKRNVECEDNTLLVWVNGSVQFLRDPTGIEALHDPVTFTERRIRRGHKPYGDCDDEAIYLATLLKSIGHAPYFKVISRMGNRFHHVFVSCHGRDLDPTLQLGTIRGQPNREAYFPI